MNYPKGSEWRRWDLHVHTKGTLKEDKFKSPSFEDFCIVLFKKAIENEIAVIGITDYFSIENYLKVTQFVSDIDKCSNFSDDEKFTIKNILLIPNVELRMLPSTDSGRLVNIHCLFNPVFVDSLENHFFSSLEHSGGNGKKYKMNRQGMIELGREEDISLNEEEAYIKGVSKFVVSHERLQELKDTDNQFRENVIIGVSNSSNDGASGLQKHYDLFESGTSSTLDGVRLAIYKISDCIFSGNPNDAEYFVGRRGDKEQTVELKCGTLKPCIHGSDAHTEDKLFKPDKDRYCWIKADPTFNGLRQILYEPLPGDRIHIGQTKPDQKPGYKVIEKITFWDTSDFPREILFNSNLCSIIGSRSVGKSALLAYISDAIDTEQTRDKKPKGPGEGFPWDAVSFDYSIEWANGKSNEESPGKIVYIPQNFLFEMSGKPEEIKRRILPVLTLKLPQIGFKYLKTERDTKDINGEISKTVEKWFEEKNQSETIIEELQDLGGLEAVKGEKTKIDEEILLIKEKFKLNDSDVQRHQELNEEVAEFEQRISQINNELNQIGEEGKEAKYFSKSGISLTPSIRELPDPLQVEINNKIDEWSLKLVSDVNKIVSSYYLSIEKEKTTTEEKLAASSRELKTLIEKQEKNEKLESLIKKSSDLKTTIAQIESDSKKLETCQKRLRELEEEIASSIKKRDDCINGLIMEIQEVDQTTIKDMTFGIEAKIEENDFERFKQKINTRNRSEYVISAVPDLCAIRSRSDEFLEALYSGEQKINQGYEKLEVGIEALTLTEEILFTAEMEQDRIGGFSEPTMTPGKRALFALRLMLAESEDTWPLLIDQPEDDLDSRSIYDDIVPFLREKKCERQIIMVSHNANLVIGSDSEQIIVANRHGEDRINEDGLQFNYLSGSIEFSKLHDSKCIDTLKSCGVREHACQILEGGELAFERRGNRYDIIRDKKA